MLDRRLQTVADLTRDGSRVADIGTDHALLPCALVAAGRCPSAIASDIRVGPTEAAQKTVAATGLEQTVSVRLGAGLQTVSPDEVDDIVIAGMGGETIASILEDAAWTKDPHYRLILQPMTRPERLRRFLYDNGFDIQTETVAKDGRRLYTVLCVTYSGVVRQFEEAVYYIGKMDAKQGKEYLETVCRRLQKEQAHTNESLSVCIEQIEAYIQQRWNPWEDDQ